MDLKDILISEWHKKGAMLMRTETKRLSSIVLDPVFVEEVLISAMKEACNQTVDLCLKHIEKEFNINSYFMMSVQDMLDFIKSFEEIKNQINS